MIVITCTLQKSIVLINCFQGQCRRWLCPVQTGCMLARGRGEPDDRQTRPRRKIPPGLSSTAGEGSSMQARAGQGRMGMRAGPADVPPAVPVGVGGGGGGGGVGSARLVGNIFLIRRRHFKMAPLIPRAPRTRRYGDTSHCRDDKKRAPPAHCRCPAQPRGLPQ